MRASVASGLVVAVLVAAGAGAARGRDRRNDAPAPTSRVSLRPIDEAGRDRSLVDFRKTLREIVGRKDAAALLKLVDSQVDSNFGELGVAAFRKEFRPDDANSEVWKILGEVLDMGGAFHFHDKLPSFCAPYVFAAFPDEFDAFFYAAVTADGVPLRREHRKNAAVASMLHYDIVRLISDRPVTAQGTRWRKVALPTGRQGWVEEAVVRSPIDYRVCFQKTTAGWRISALAQGD